MNLDKNTVEVHIDLKHIHKPYIAVKKNPDGTYDSIGASTNKSYLMKKYDCVIENLSLKMIKDGGSKLPKKVVNSLEEAIKEKRRKEAEYQKPKTNDDIIRWFSIVMVIVESKNKLQVYKEYVDEYDEDCDGKWNTLGKICQNLGVSIKDSEIITVICERGLDGEIWQYGNYGDNKWYYHGDTRGYA